jgi:hypothetical protein
MVNKVAVKDYELANEIVNFIFVKQNNKNYCFNYFPKDFYGIRYYIKKYDVIYIKEEDIKLIVVCNNEEIEYLYFKDIIYLKQNIQYLKGKELLINKDNILANELINMNIDDNINSFYTSFTLKMDINNKIFKQQLNKKYIVIPLLKHLINDYLSIHSNNHYQNQNTLVCIKNNEMIGYLDFKEDEIFEICSISKKEEIFKKTIEQLLLNYLISTNKKEVIYQTDDLNTYNLLIELGFIKIEENINMEF